MGYPFHVVWILMTLIEDNPKSIENAIRSAILEQRADVLSVIDKVSNMDVSFCIFHISSIL